MKEADLIWKGLGGRDGWWLLFEDEGVAAIMGPSICSSSGGGPQQALKKAQAEFQDEYPDLKITVHPPPRHTLWPTSNTCARCAEICKILKDVPMPEKIEIDQKTAVESGAAKTHTLQKEGVHSINAFEPHSFVLQFRNEAGKMATIQLKEGKVTYSGELPIDEAAQLFFKHTIMQWRDFRRDEEYENAKLAVLEAGYTDKDRLAAVIRDLADTRDLWKTVLETIRYEARQENTERMQRILKYVERTLGVVKA